MSTGVLKKTGECTLMFRGQLYTTYKPALNSSQRMNFTVEFAPFSLNRNLE